MPAWWRPTTPRPRAATTRRCASFASPFGPFATSTNPAFAWALGNLAAVSARAAARAGMVDEAVRFLGIVSPWLERAPAWTPNFPGMACYAAETLWLLQRLGPPCGHRTRPRRKGDSARLSLSHRGRTIGARPTFRPDLPLRRGPLLVRRIATRPHRRRRPFTAGHCRL